MAVVCTGHDRNMTVTISGEVDHHGAKKIMEELDRQMEVVLPKQITVDLGGVSFMDSSGIGVIIGRYQNLRYAGGEVVASHLNARMSKIFVISGLHKIVRIEKEEDGSESGDEK